MIDEVKEFIIIAFSVIIVMIILVLTVAIPITIVDKEVFCPNFGKATEKNVKYDFWAGGCFVELDNGQYIQKMNYQGVNIE